MPMSARGSTRRFVLDANALFGFFEGRHVVAEKMRHLLGEALRQDLPLLISAVTWGEVFYIAWRRHGERNAREAGARLERMPIAVIPVDRDRASRAGALKQKHSLAYADALAAELAIEQGAWLVTADPEFSRVGKELLVYSLPRHEK
jgi:predicted nucleic acid-binding protein